MSDINLSTGTVSPADYMRFKLRVKAYEHEHDDLAPFKKLKKGVFKIGTGSVSTNSAVHNFLNTLLHKYGSGICETYFQDETPIVSVAYKVNQGAFNKKENVSIHVFPQGETHKNYYIANAAIKNDMVTNDIIKLI